MLYSEQDLHGCEVCRIVLTENDREQYTWEIIRERLQIIGAVRPRVDRYVYTLVVPSLSSKFIKNSHKNLPV